MIARSIAFECPQKNGYFKDPSDPHKFYECADGEPVEMPCPESLVFDENIKVCTYDGKGVIAEKPSVDCQGKTGFFKDSSDPHKFHECVDGQMVTFTCPESLIFDETKNSCNYDSKAVTSSGHVTLSPDCPENNGFFKDPKSTHKFIECINGLPYPFVCPENLVFDTIKKTCAYEGNSVTTEKPSVDCQGKTGFFKDSSDPHKFHECAGGQMVTFTCPENLIFDETKNSCNYDSKAVTSSGHVTLSPDCPENNGFFKDPKSTHQFIECINGLPYRFVCPENLVFDTIKKSCTYDLKSDVTEKPGVDCVGKTGFFKDPSNPHKFHECVGGQMVTFTCPEDLIFDTNSNTCIYDSSKTVATAGHTVESHTDSPHVTPSAGPTQHPVTEGTRIRHTNSP